MATVRPTASEARRADADHSAHQYKAVRRKADGTVGLAATTDQVAGVISVPGEASGRLTHYHTAGESKIRVLGAVAPGDKLKISATPGVATKAAAGEDFFGEVLDVAPDGAVAPFVFDRGTL